MATFSEATFGPSRQASLQKVRVRTGIHIPARAGQGSQKFRKLFPAQRVLQFHGVVKQAGVTLRLNQARLVKLQRNRQMVASKATVTNKPG